MRRRVDLVLCGGRIVLHSLGVRNHGVERVYHGLRDPLVSGIHVRAINADRDTVLGGVGGSDAAIQCALINGCSRRRDDYRGIRPRLMGIRSFYAHIVGTRRKTGGFGVGAVHRAGKIGVIGILHRCRCSGDFSVRTACRYGGDALKISRRSGAVRFVDGDTLRRVNACAVCRQCDNGITHRERTCFVRRIISKVRVLRPVVIGCLHHHACGVENFPVLVRNRGGRRGNGDRLQRLCRRFGEHNRHGKVLAIASVVGNAGRSFMEKRI